MEELTSEQENFISDVACEAKKLRELELQEDEFKPIFEIIIPPEPTPEEIQELFDEVYEDVTDDPFGQDKDLDWLDDLYVKEQRESDLIERMI